MQPIRERMVTDLQQVYGSKLKLWLGNWRELGIVIWQRGTKELLRFGGVQPYKRRYGMESFFIL
jgi:hypothetical protein